MVWPAVIAAGVAAAATIGGGVLANRSSKKSTKWSARFGKNMYKKRYQYTVRDMRKAGLNPVLAATGGNVGGQPSAPTYTAQNVAAGASSAVKDVAGAVKQKQMQKAEYDALRQQMWTMQSQERLNNRKGQIGYWEIEKAMHDAASAKELASQMRTRTQRYEKYGESGLGSNAFSLETLIQRLARENQRQKEQ